MSEVYAFDIPQENKHLESNMIELILALLGTAFLAAFNAAISAFVATLFAAY